jgi:hypothetical protein
LLPCCGEKKLLMVWPGLVDWGIQMEFNMAGIRELELNTMMSLCLLDGD